MTRPSDWWVLDLEGDPTPGSPGAVRRMARTWSRVAEDAAWAERRVRQLMGDEALGRWIGEAGDAFRHKTGDLPDQLGKCSDSYGRASDALSWWAGRLETHQHDADSALVRGRAAHDDLEEARRRAAAAASAVSHASGASVLTDPSLTPTPEQVRDARARLHSAQAARSSADAAVSAAQSRLDAARALALDAKHLREADGRTTASRIHEAADAGIPERSRWEKLKDWAGEAWHVIVQIAKVVVAVLGVVALIIGGPLAWVVFAAALILLADSIMKYMKGECALWEVALAALGCIPGTKGLTTLAELRAAFALGGFAKAGGLVLSSARSALVGMAAAAREMGQGAHLAVIAFRGRASELLSGLSALRNEVGAVSLGLERGVDATADLYAGGNHLLGAADLPTSGHLGDLLRGYDRLGGEASADDFLARYHHGDWDWPDFDGFDGARVDMPMRPGEVLDRFGSPDGRYLAPDGTPFPERAMPPDSLDPTAEVDLNYHRYEVLKPFDVPTGYIAPAFGQPGGGLQMFVDGNKFPDALPTDRVNVQWLLDHDYLKEVPVP